MMNIKGVDYSSQYNLVPVPLHTHNGIDSPKIDIKNLQGLPSCGVFAVTTNGTNSVSVSRMQFIPFTITGMYLISNDTTAANITMSNGTNTVATIAKGTIAGALVGATSLSNTSHAAGDTISVVSSSTGNSTVFITFNL